MYHEVANRAEMDDLARRTQSGYVLTPADFAQQMAFIAEAGFRAISLDQLWSWSQSGVSLPDNPVVVTFDDGFAGNYRFVFPVLRQLGLTATFFVISERIGAPLMMTWAQLDEMRRHGMAIESHTASHFLFSGLSEARTEEQLRVSKRTIEEKLGHPVSFVSLPYGDHNRFYPRIAAGMGYKGGCGSEFGFNTPSTDRFFWRRIAVRQGMSFQDFRDILLRTPRKMFYYAASSGAKRAAARVIGKKNYDRIYNFVFGVDEKLG